MAKPRVTVHILTRCHRCWNALQHHMGSRLSWNLQQARRGYTVRLQRNSEGNCQRQPFVLEFKARGAGLLLRGGRG